MTPPARPEAGQQPAAGRRSGPPATVLFVGPDPHKPGGVATFCRSVFPELRFPAEYFVRGTSSPSAGIPARAVRPVGDYAAFARRLRDDRYRIVHLNLSLSRVSVLRDRGFVHAAKHAGRAVVLGIHGWNRRFFDAALRSRRGGVRRLLTAADRIFVANADARRGLEAAGYGDVVEVVPAVIEAELVDDLHFDDLEAGRRGPPVLLFLARLEPSKGALETVEAFERVKRRLPEAELLVAGAGSVAVEVENLVKRRQIGGVRLLGHVTGEAKVDAFRRATLYLLPSTHDEGMPHSLVEAMAFGLPVIVSPVGGVRDFFVDGEMGLLSRSSDPGELAWLAQELIDDPERCRRVGRRNFAFARAEFSAAGVASRFDAAYGRLID